MQVGKTVITMEQLHTLSEPSSEDGNHVVVRFQALMIDIPTNLEGEPAVVEDVPYYITAGAEYGNGAYIWVEHLEVNVQRTNHVSCNQLLKSSLQPLFFNRKEPQLCKQAYRILK